MKMWMLALVMVGLVAAQGELDEVTEDHIKDLTKDNGLDMAKSFRCGLFFAGEEPGAKPRETLYIIPKLFPGNCPAAGEPSADSDLLTYKTFCKKLFQKIGKKVNYETPSINKTRAEEGFNVGDDICGLLFKDHQIRHVGHKRNEKAKDTKYPNGLEIGFYHNSCENSEWLDTDLRMPEGPICCKGSRQPNKLTGKAEFIPRFLRCKGQASPNDIV